MSRVTVTTWADEDIEPDFTSGRWVQLGSASRLAFLLTGLPGGKVHLHSSFPFVRYQPCQVPFSNHKTADVDRSRLVFPRGLGFDGCIKGLLGQRRLV